MRLRHPSIKISRMAVVLATALLTGCGDEEQTPEARAEAAVEQTAETSAAASVGESAAKAGQPQLTVSAAVAESSSGQSAQEPQSEGNAAQTQADLLYRQACEDLKKEGEEAKKKAFEALTRAAGLGHAAAQYKLGSCYRQGIGTAVDLAQTVKWFEKAADAHDVQAQRELAFMYHQGEGVERNPDKAEQYYRIVTAQNPDDVESLVLLGFVQSESETRLPEAVVTFREAAGKGNPYAQVALGVLTLQGRGGIAPNAQEAYRLFSAAADDGIADALCNQGYCLETGTGTGRNETKAVECYTKAIAAVPLPQAKYNLALCYLNGRGVARDVQKAMPLLVDAANAGHADALCELSRCCALGIGVPKDEKQAFSLCVQAAQAGSAEAQYTLAQYFRRGEVVEKDETFARQCLETAAANGHELAAKELGNPQQ